MIVVTKAYINIFKLINKNGPPMNKADVNIEKTRKAFQSKAYHPRNT